MKRKNCAALIAVGCIYLLPLAAQAGIRAESIELSPFGGYNFFENDQNLNDDLLGGGRIGYNFTHHFDFDKATLNPEAKEILKENIQLLKKNRKAQIRIAGYTSASGTEDYNKSLSVRRAKGVEDYLIAEGLVDPDRLFTIGYGERRPDVYEAAPKELYSPAAKANMRVEFEVIVQ
jgi:outer membrane protein OmpA-like peptidoglycan-associated protein